MFFKITLDIIYILEYLITFYLIIVYKSVSVCIIIDDSVFLINSKL